VILWGNAATILGSDQWGPVALSIPSLVHCTCIRWFSMGPSIDRPMFLHGHCTFIPFWGKQTLVYYIPGLRHAMPFIYSPGEWTLSWVWGMSGQHGSWRLGAVLVHPADRTGKFVKLNWPGCPGIYVRLCTTSSCENEHAWSYLPVSCHQWQQPLPNSHQMHAAGMQIPMARSSCGLHDASAGRVRESECFVQCLRCC